MRTAFWTCAMAAVCGGTAAFGALNIPSDGSDGALTITSSTVIDLSQAVTGNWDLNNSANAGKGVYDPAKWAVVFKYTSVNIASGATVTFKNHASRAPVVWLVQGDVTINGTVNLSGQNSVDPPALAEPGPGGFRGGAGNYAPGATDAAGFGPGGGRVNVGDSWGPFGAAGSYGSLGSYGSTAYGNPSLIPLIGGSGAAGRERTYGDAHPRSGGGGGGAILIASRTTLAIPGAVYADGGSGIWSSSLDRDSSSGSGGGIRLIADSFSGSGIVRAIGGGGSIAGGLGRIRLERSVNNSSYQVTPDPSVVTLPADSTPQIWLPDGGPTVRIVSIGGTAAPTDPRAEFGTIGADISLAQVSTTPVVVETTNVEQASTVTVRATPRIDGDFTTAAASVTQVVSTDPLVIRWTANLPVKTGYSAVQVRVVRP